MHTSVPARSIEGKSLQLLTFNISNKHCTALMHTHIGSLIKVHKEFLEPDGWALSIVIILLNCKKKLHVEFSSVRR